ncbi:MAG: DUF1559 domain-containing protein [Planctomycetaceae bacterium]|nr:DUF1559 domain-containing protein [Planctomycetaceae bacterium]
MRHAFTLIELLVVVIIVSVLVVLLVVLIQRSREGARRMQCENNLRQLAIAVHNFHDVQKQLPKANFQPQFCREQFLNSETGGYGNRELYGFLPVLMPYLESNPYYEILTMQLNREGEAPAPWDQAWTGELGTPTIGKFADSPPISQARLASMFLCPSDPMRRNLQAGDFGRTNYLGCRGDIWVHWQSPSTRGIFISGPNPPIGFNHVFSGTSNVILFAECVIGNNHGGHDVPVRGGMAYGMPFGADAVPMRCLERAGKDGKLSGGQNHDVLTDMRGAGLCWLSGRQANGQFFTILPPNSPSCSSETDWPDWALNSASSYHAGGCNSVLADGSSQYISNAVTCGDLSQTALDNLDARSLYETAESVLGHSISPWGVWGAVGCRQMQYGL